MSSTTPPVWHRCFICSSPIANNPSALAPPQGLKYSSSQSQAHLLKYLLQDPELSNQLSTDVLQVLEGQGDSKRVGTCAFCCKLADALLELQLDLEVLQMKIVDRLVTVKKAVIGNSRFYGENAAAKTDFEKYKAILEQSEQDGGASCDKERKFLDVLHRFQTFVFENDSRYHGVPLVYLERYIGHGALPSTKGIMIIPTNSIKEEPDDDYEETTRLNSVCPAIADSHTDSENSIHYPEKRRRKRKVAPAPSSKLKERIYKKTEVDVCSEPRPKLEHGRKGIPLDSNHKYIRPSRSRDVVSKARQLRLKLYKDAKKQGTMKTANSNSQRIWECEGCAYKDKSASNMQCHLQSHETEEKNYYCPDCKQGFTQKLFMEVHLLEHVRTKQCEVCEKRFSRFDLWEHVKCHYEKVYCCQFCGYSFGKLQEYVAHVRRHPAGARIKCDLCPPKVESVYSVRSEFPGHLSDCHGLKEFEFVCEFPGCARRFFDSRSLKACMQSHLSKSKREEPEVEYRVKFECPECNMTLAGLQAFNNHMKTVHQPEISKGKNNETLAEGPSESTSQHFKSRDKRCKKRVKRPPKPNKKYRTPDSAARTLRLQLYKAAKTEGKLVHQGEWANRIWQCEECPFKAKLGIHMEYHLKGHETPEKHYECPDCKRRFTQKLYLELHLLSHVRRKKCDVCDEKFTRFELKEHLRTHNDKVYECECCDHCFGRVNNFVMHVGLHQGAPLLKCFLCPETEPTLYSPRQELPRHLFEVHGQEVGMKCKEPYCHEVFFDKDAFRSHLNIHKKKYSCPICHLAFKWQQKVKSHMRFHHPDKLEDFFHCDSCPKKFPTQKALGRHNMEEHDAPKFECELCHGLTWLSWEGLRYHRRKTHGIGKQLPVYQCPYCEKKFTNMTKFQAHQSLHNDTLDFTCEVCGHSFKSAFQLKRHSHIHNEKQYECEYCQKKFTMRKYLNIHVRTHTQDKPYGCELCGVSFVNKSNLNTHVKSRRHRDLVQSQGSA